jgi:hypothetical protein
MRQMSKRRRKRDAGYQLARYDVYLRADAACEAMVDDRCLRTMTDVHHRAGRGGDDPHRLSNLLGCCRPCHDWIHAHPEASYAAGFMVRRNGKDLT